MDKYSEDASFKQKSYFHNYLSFEMSVTVEVYIEITFHHEPWHQRRFSQSLIRALLTEPYLKFIPNFIRALQMELSAHKLLLQIVCALSLICQSCVLSQQTTTEVFTFYCMPAT